MWSPFFCSIVRKSELFESVLNHIRYFSFAVSAGGDLCRRAK